MIQEWCGESSGRLIPLCLIPLWDPQLAADEVRRTAALGCRAYAFSEQPADLGLPSVHSRDRHWDPFLTACDEIQAVVCMHIGSSSKIRTTSDDAPPGVRMALTFANAQSSMTDWLLSGILARFPRMRIAYSEGQIGWMPFVLERLDNIFTNSRAWAGLDDAITELPSSYVPGRVYGCFFEDDFGLSVRDSIGVEQIAFETDYPHQDSTWPDSYEIVARMALSLTPNEIHRVVRGTAIEMFQLDLN
jgi:predicted TIM-barrel fold metal-dependent hydrolase